MRKWTAILTLPLLLLGVFLMGCSKQDNKIDENLLPKRADDISVQNELGNYNILASVPLYTLNGIYGGVTSKTGDAVSIEYMGVSAEDFQAYAESLQNSSWQLKEGSKVWLTEGWMGMPQFVKNGIMITLSWSVTDGNLIMSVAYA